MKKVSPGTDASKAVWVGPAIKGGTGAGESHRESAKPGPRQACRGSVLNVVTPGKFVRGSVVEELCPGGRVASTY